MIQKFVKGETQVAAFFSMAILILSVATISSMATQNPKANALVAPECSNITIAGVTANGYASSDRKPENAIDSNFNTRWSNDGIGSWLRLDLGEKKAVCYVDIAWYNGDGRINNFAISVSSDDSTYTNVFSGKSSGKTNSFERYDFADTEARYVKITVNGNQWNDWASITEVDVYGSSSTNSGSSGGSNSVAINFANVVENQILSGTYNVVVIASDPTKISRIDVYVDNTFIKTEKYNPYEFGVDTTKFADGSHVLKAVATDNSANKISISLAVSFENQLGPQPEPTPEPTQGNVALVMYASWLSMSEFKDMFTGNLNGDDQIRYRVTDYPNGYSQSDVDALKAFKATVPGLKLGISIAYSDKIVKYAAQIKNQGFDFVEYNLEAAFDGPNSDSEAQNNLVKITKAADAVHAQGMKFRVTPGKPNSASFLRTGLLDDVAKVVDYYHIQAQSIQDQGPDAYADFTESISKVLRAAKPGILITSQLSPGQGAEPGKTVQQTMRDVTTEAMSRPPPGNTKGAGMWIGGDDVEEAKSFFTWFNKSYP